MRRARIVRERNEEQQQQEADEGASCVHHAARKSSPPSPNNQAHHGRSAARDRLRSVSKNQIRTSSRNSQLASLLNEPSEAAQIDQLPPLLRWAVDLSKGTPLLEELIQPLTSEDASLEARALRAAHLLPQRSALSLWRRTIEQKKEDRRTRAAHAAACTEALRQWQSRRYVPPVMHDWRAVTRKNNQLLANSQTGAGMWRSSMRAVLFNFRDYAFEFNEHKDLARYVIARMDPRGRAKGRAVARWLDYTCEVLEYQSVLRAAAVTLAVDLRAQQRAVLVWIELCARCRVREMMIKASLEKKSPERRYARVQRVCGCPRTRRCATAVRPLCDRCATAVRADCLAPSCMHAHLHKP